MAVHLLGNAPQFSNELPLLGRATATTADVAMDLASPIQMGHVLNVSNPHVSSKALSILNCLSVLSLVTGPVLCERALREMRLCREAGDRLGERISQIDLAKGSLQIAAGGACALPAAVITVALFFTTSKVAKVAGQILMQVGAAIFGVVACLEALSAVLELGIAWSCRKTITQKATPEEALLELQTQLKDPVLKRAWMRSLDERLIASVLGASAPLAKVMIDRVLWAQAKEMALEGVILALSLAGAGLTVLGFCLTAPIALTVAGMILSMAWLIIDMGAFMETAESTKFDSYEKPLLIACAIFCGLIVLGAAYFATGGLALGITIAMGILLAILHLVLITKA